MTCLTIWLSLRDIINDWYQYQSQYLNSILWYILISLSISTVDMLLIVILLLIILMCEKSCCCEVSVAISILFLWLLCCDHDCLCSFCHLLEFECHTLDSSYEIWIFSMYQFLHEVQWVQIIVMLKKKEANVCEHDVTVVDC